MAVTRSARGSYWQLPDGRFFVPNVDQVGGYNPEAPMVDENGRLVADENGNLRPAATPQQEYGVYDSNGAWKAIAPGANAPGAGGTPFTYSGELPGFGPQGSYSGTVYASQPQEKYFQSAKDEGLGPWLRTMALFAGLGTGANFLSGGGIPGVDAAWGANPAEAGSMMENAAGAYNYPVDPALFQPANTATGASMLENASGAYNYPVDPNLIPKPNYTIPGVGDVYGPQVPGARAPVEDRSTTYDPNSQSYIPNLGNAAASLAGKAGASAGTAGAVGDAAGGLSQIKNALSLSSAVGSLLKGLNMPSVGETGTTLARASEGARRRVVGANTDAINQAFSGFDDRYFNSIADAFKNYYQPTVNRQFDTAQRNILYSAPGGVGSSEFSRQLTEAERERQQAGTDVADQAQNEAMSARNQIEGTKANLLGLAESSEDPAAFGQQAIAGAQASSYVPKYSAIGDLVSRYASLANAAGGLESQGYNRVAVKPISFGGGGSRSSVQNSVGGWR